MMQFERRKIKPLLSYSNIFNLDIAKVVWMGISTIYMYSNYYYVLDSFHYKTCSNIDEDHVYENEAQH